MELSRGKSILLTATLFIVGSYFLILSLIKAQGFLAPLVMAIVLALLMIPLAKKIEKTKINRAFASLICTFILFLISLGIFAVLSFQVKNFVDDWEEIKEQMQPKIEQAEEYIYEHTNLSKEDFEEYKEQNNLSTLASSGSSGERAFSFMKKVVDFISNYLLTFIYIFFLINYRNRFKNFFLRLVSKEQQQNARKIIHRTATIVQQYLVGKAFLIVFLSVLYSVGLGFSGVDNFILISFIAAFLSLIPFIGNIIGFMLALVFGFLTTGETTVLIGIIITFTLVQFIESYILEPYVVGDKVNLHPFLVILAIIAGNMIWGVMGMILAIPVLGILNVILRHVKPLKPFGYLLSTDKQNDKD
ncbi:AI-2E family transporter [Antarcticibacterium flavum]|uniref:AI-2E family transporter n=1 Tax=Antarcticibacterium flavum TaxID=2058175 RepID=A0A5B7X0S4_9FLAO|nr:MULTISPECIES: AI-2E family transporter [Antarcticibacterium]MCM4158959.1 AI-2E family transporter [Antarcticibacterium sp. W02-3]QCY68211.1 AI-2E family transporter [Antarcticibacterium flavum]